MGSNFIYQPVAHIISIDNQTQWIQEIKNHADTFMKIDGDNESLIDIYSRLERGESEQSGAVGARWMSISKGGRATSLCHPSVTFSWHYHPSGPPVFSFQDWLSFLMSGAALSCLFTKQGLCLYIKEKHDERDRLVRDLKAMWLEGQDKPNLLFLRAKRLIEDALSLESFLCAPVGYIEKNLGVYSESWMHHE